MIGRHGKSLLVDIMTEFYISQGKTVLIATTRTKAVLERLQHRFPGVVFTIDRDGFIHFNNKNWNGQCMIDGSKSSTDCS